MPTTLKEMRNSVASAVKDRVSLIATGGSVSTLQDQLALTRFNDTLRGSQLYFSSGNNQGRLVTVISNNLNDSTVTFQPELDYPVQVGDRADLFNVMNTGFPFRDYDEAIRTVCSGRDRKNVKRSTIDIPTWVSDTGALTIPDGLIAVYAVEARFNDAGVDHVVDIPPARYRNSKGWFVEPATRQLVIGGSSRQVYDGDALTVLGYVPVGLPYEDADEILLDEEWVRFSAIAHLCMNRSGQHDRWAIEAMQKASAREAFVTPRIAPNTVWLLETTS